jgi:hypothetical protein
MATHFRMKNEMQIQSELCEGLLISEAEVLFRPPYFKDV